MGRSPGKWIKTVLFGKKSSRSSLSKGKDNLKSSHEKEALISSTAQSDSLVVSHPLVPQTEPIENQINGEKPESEMRASSNSQRDGVAIAPGNQGADEQGIDALNGADRVRQEQAATKAQAAFRGYLARRAFRALMGIIRLQALVRGHLVRRQAVATLCCVRGIVKFQALVRGQREDAKASNSCGSHTLIHADKLLGNSFICKLLASSPNTKPLCLQYELGEPNSALSWLERWTKLRVWALPQRKKVIESKSTTKPKRSVRKVPAANLDSSSSRSISAPEKPKRNIRKTPSTTLDLGQESSQNEFEKVKRSLRKVSNSTNESERLKSNPRKSIGGSAAPGIPDQGMIESSERKDHEEECIPKPLPETEIIETLHEDHLTFDSPPLENYEKDENSEVTNGKIVSKEDEASNENQKASKRRASLPSYMLATESAKAKLRAQGSPKPVSDVTDQNGSTRRHSLPSSINGKMSSLSPRTQRPQANSKGVIKHDRSILSSKDGNEKVAQVEWKR